MTAERSIVAVLLVAAGLLTAALLATGAVSVPLGLGGQRGLPVAEWLSLMPISPGNLKAGDGPVLLAGVAIGWALRWLYTRPWATYPRAFVAWLASWRTPAALAGLAVACLGVLLFY
ncbi:MAG: hypothetical protein AB7O57_12970 [Hyphomicrobiaceae bacterium]